MAVKLGLKEVKYLTPNLTVNGGARKQPLCQLISEAIVQLFSLPHGPISCFSVFYVL